MTIKRIVAIPVDPRPVVCAQVVDLVALAGVTLTVPPAAMLGHFRVAADTDALFCWLEKQLATADGVVLSLDMLLYGGLVPSRFSTEAAPQIAARLARIRALRETCDLAVPWFAFAATLRISNNNINDEEKQYWREYGEKIWAWSYHSDRAEVTGDAGAQARALAARGTIPSEIQEDYLATRRRNFSMLSRAIDYLAEGIFDRLILPQDDTAGFGFNIAERRRLEARVHEAGLGERVAIYAGADEVLHTLCARLVGAGTAPKLYVVFTDPAHVAKLTARYEDRPLLASLAAQIAAVGAERVTTQEDADVLLLVHSQGETQGDWAMRSPLAASFAVDPPCWHALERAQAAAQPIAVIDLAYANGGDRQFIDTLASRLPLGNLAAYAGWNTAGNAIGSCLAQLVVSGGGASAVDNRRIVCLRLLEDLVYQADVRQRVRAVIDEASLSAAQLQQAVAEKFLPVADAWLEQHQFPWRVAGIRLPWNRTFEIDIAMRAAEGAA